MNTITYMVQRRPPRRYCSWLEFGYCLHIYNFIYIYVYNIFNIFFNNIFYISSSEMETNDSDEIVVDSSSPKRESSDVIEVIENTRFAHNFF